MATIRMKLLDVPDITEQDWQDFISIRSDMLGETYPDSPVPSYENQKIEYSSAREWENLVQIWLAYDEQEHCVGMFDTTFPRSHHPNYETNRNNLWIGFYVRKAHRCQGIGTQMLETVLERARFFGANFVYAPVELDTGHAFAKTFGAQEASVDRISRLAIVDTDWNMLQTWIDEGKAKNPDVKIVRIEGLPPANDIEAYCHLVNGIVETVPHQDIEDEEYTLTVEELRKTHQRNLERGHRYIALYAKDKDNSLMGVTGMVHENVDEKNSYVGLTGVLPEYRGRGLGKYLKALMSYDLREHFPKVQYAYTGNAEVNAPMLSINVRMGFKPYKRRSIYKIALEDLAAKI